MRKASQASTHAQPSSWITENPRHGHRETLPVPTGTTNPPGRPSPSLVLETPCSMPSRGDENSLQISAERSETFLPRLAPLVKFLDPVASVGK